MSNRYLKATYFLDYEADCIQQIISEFKQKDISPKEKSIGIYHKVRDQWRYDPYHISLSKDNYKASTIAKRRTGNCVEKSVLLVACLRGLGIPARLHLGKVKNHIAVERLVEKFGSNELTPHGMVNLQLNGQWLKCSPAFNADLCVLFNVPPLEFDGENHSFLQEYNSEGSLFMEYIEDYGYFEDVPIEFMKSNVKAHYPHIFDRDDHITEFNL
jgi:hypothetical protein